MGPHAVDRAGEPGTDHVVGFAGEDRLDETSQLGWVVLAVGVAERHDGGAQLHGGCQPGSHGGTEAAVRAMTHDVRAGGGSNGRCVVAAPVVDDETPRRPTAHVGGQSLHHAGDSRALVVCGQDEHDGSR